MNPTVTISHEEYQHLLDCKKHLEDFADGKGKPLVFHRYYMEHGRSGGFVRTTTETDILSRLFTDCENMQRNEKWLLEQVKHMFENYSKIPSPIYALFGGKATINPDFMKDYVPHAIHMTIIEKTQQLGKTVEM